jgi:hypothetical protein
VVRRLSQDLVPIERSPDLVLSKRIGDTRGVTGWLDVTGRHRLHPGGMIEDVSELLSVGLELLRDEVEPGEARHMGDVDVDGHADSLTALARGDLDGKPGESPSRNRCARAVFGELYPRSTRMSSTVRIGTGLAAIALTLGGLVVVIQGGGTTGEVLIRTGVMLAAAWLVAPQIRRPGPATIVGLGAVALVIARPRLLVPIVIAAVVWWLARRKRVPPPRH